MKAGEIIRIIVLSVVGLLVMFWVQPLIYQNRIIRIDVPRIETWVSNYYMIAALIVCGVSLFSTIAWFVMTLLAEDHKGSDISKWSVIWWIVGILPVLSICVAIGFFNGSNDALLSLTFFFVLDILWLYWLPTATSTPGLFKYIPPFAFQIRGLMRDR